MPQAAPPTSPNNTIPQAGTLTSATKGGVAGDHPPLTTRELLVGPTTQSEFNTVNAGLIPIGCWRVNDLRFHFGSSFVAPGIREELQTLDELIQKHIVGEKKPPLSIFGHADPVGEDEFNKGLSGRRAQAIYGLLTRNTDLWEELYSQPHGEDQWGDPEIDTMLDTVSATDESASEGDAPPANRQARIEAFQAEHGLEVDGHVGVNTRRELFRAYMDTLCGDLVVDPTEFLGQGQDPEGKADYQGCSEFNPLLIFSQEEQEKFQQDQDKTKRNTENAPNRRVMVLLFRPGTTVTPERWPCPRVSENSNGCRKRFWSDGEDRRSRRNPDNRREFRDTKDTFACRFYDRLSNNSPCERILNTLLELRLFDAVHEAIPRAKFRATIGKKEIRTGEADQTGRLVIREISIPNEITVEWGYPETEVNRTDEFPFKLNIQLDASSGNDLDTSQKRLHNLGYVLSKAEDNIRAFQRDYEIKPANGILDNTTEKFLERVHNNVLSRTEFLATRSG